MQAKGEESVTQKLQEARSSNVTSQIYETSTKCPKKLIKAMITISQATILWALVRVPSNLLTKQRRKANTY